MGMATIAGGLTAYPVNYWLVKNKIKHGCMTIQPASKMEHHDHEHHQMKSLSISTQAFGILATFLLLFAAGYLTTYFAPILFNEG